MKKVSLVLLSLWFRRLGDLPRNLCGFLRVDVTPDGPGLLALHVYDDAGRGFFVQPLQHGTRLRRRRLLINTGQVPVSLVFKSLRMLQKTR